MCESSIATVILHELLVEEQHKRSSVSESHYLAVDLIAHYASMLLRDDHPGPTVLPSECPHRIGVYSIFS